MRDPGGESSFDAGFEIELPTVNFVGTPRTGCNGKQVEAVVFRGHAIDLWA